MGLFGAPVAHEDHAVRACYAALRMQDAVSRHAEAACRDHGVRIRIRVGLNSCEVVVRAIGSDLHMDYTAIGHTTHLAARMEQIAEPGTVLLLGLGLALLLNRKIGARPIITALLAIPPMVSPVMAAMAWRMMFGVKYGAINNMGLQLGLIDVYFDWFSTPFRSILAVVLVDVWHNTPFMMLVLLAGLQSIPPDLYEAARADGASAWKSFWFITLPLLKFTAAVAVMIRMIDLTKLFGLIFVLTFGGPGGATETLAFNTYLVGFNDFRMSYASALSYLIIVIVLVLTLIFLRLSRPRDARAAA